MTQTDDLVTGALDLGYKLLDTWFSAFRNLAASSAEVVNPDQIVLGDNVCKARAKPARASGIRCGTLTGTTNGVALPPHLVTISPAGVVGPDPIVDANGNVTGSAPRLQEILIWITAMDNLPDEVTTDMYTGDVFDDAGVAIAKVAIHVSRDAASIF